MDLGFEHAGGDAVSDAQEVHRNRSGRAGMGSGGNADFSGSGHEKLSQIFQDGGAIIADGHPASRKPAPTFC